MMDYVTINGKKYRKGYTTGSCAAAAARAAVKMLFDGTAVEQVEIDTPAGVRLNLPVSDICLRGDSASCAVIKDGGDDPDATTGLKIFARAVEINDRSISITSGEGIGIVTLPGLKVPVGQPAINPVPMKMILKEVGEVLPEGRGVEVCITVPGGEEAARKTYNPKLGIKGGISILGTSGIVEPMSEEAWKESLELELKIMAEKGFKQLVFTSGNYGRDFAVEKLGIDDACIIKISNFVGFMLDKASENGMEEILLVGHPGKLVKVAAGIFHTHSRVADARMEILAAYAALEGASGEVTGHIYGCRTTDAADEIIRIYGLERVYERITSNVSRRCSEYTFNKIKVGTVLFNSSDTLLYIDEPGKGILERVRSSHEE